MFLLTRNGEFEAFNANREYVIFKSIDLVEALKVETLTKFYQTIKEGKNGLQQGNPDRPSDERPGD